jgi:hypothetical protein
LQQNLAAVAAISQRESVTYKLARFLSRLQVASARQDRLAEVLDELAVQLKVSKNRTHAVVQCRDILRANTFPPLRGTIKAIQARTPRDQIWLPQEQAEAIQFGARIPEMQWRIVKRLLGAFHVRRKGTGELSTPNKDLLRSARGRAKIIHRLVADSMEEFDKVEIEVKSERKAGKRA